MSTNLEKRIHVIESVVLRAPRSIGIHAVDHLIAFPDEEMKAAALVRLSQQLPEGEVRSKVDSCIGDYLDFLSDVEESYPSLKAGLSGGIIFALKYLKLKKEGDQRGLKELLDSAHFSSKFYAEALMDYGLQEGDDEYFKRGMELADPEDVGKILKGRSPRDGALQLDLAEMLLQSEDKEIVLAAVRQISNIDDTEMDKKLSMVLQNYQKLSISPEGKVLLEQAIPAAYERSPDKDKFVKRFFGIDAKRAVGLAERLAGEKTTFSEIYEIAELVMKHSQEDPIKICDIAIAAEDSYENVVKVAQKASGKDVAVRYFEQALQKRAKLSDYQSTGDIILGKRLEDLAERFYEKSLGRKKSAKRYKDLGEHCLQLGSTSLARRFIGRAAEKAGTFDEYCGLYKSLLKTASQNEVVDIFRKGLERFNAAEDYKAALGYLEENYGVAAAAKFASTCGEVPGDVKELCASYVSRAEAPIKEIEMQAEALKDQKLLRELLREPPRDPAPVSRSSDKENGYYVPRGIINQENNKREIYDLSNKKDEWYKSFRDDKESLIIKKKYF